MNSMIFCENIFGNNYFYLIYENQKTFLRDIKGIYCSQQFKIIFKKKAYERSAKYPQSWRFFYFFGQCAQSFFPLLATTTTLAFAEFL